VSIQADMQCAYNYFDAPGRLKRMTMVQPFLTANETITPSLSVDADFIIQTNAAPVTIVSSGALWDTATWDSGVWFGGSVQTTNWLSTEAMGHALAVHMTANFAPFSGGVPGGQAVFDYSFFDQAQFDFGINTSETDLQVNAFNVLIELGGFI
jgi:hypothetical protein